jgi:hypothetical protein
METSSGMRGSTACTLIGLAAVVMGSVAFLADGGSGIAGRALGALAATDRNTALFMAATVAVLGTGMIKPRLLAYPLMAFAALGSVFLCVTSALGWSRYMGFGISPSMPALGSLGMGLGAFTAALGLAALAWCKTPLVEPTGRGGQEQYPKGNKWLAVAMVGIFVVLLPGFVAGLPMPEPRRAANGQALGDSAQRFSPLVDWAG